MTEMYKVANQAEQSDCKESPTSSPCQQVTQGVNAQLIERILERTSEHPDALVNVLLSAWAVLIGRLGGQDEIRLNVRWNSRLAPGESHSHLVRIVLSDDPTVKQLSLQPAVTLHRRMPGDFIEVDAEHAETNLRLAFVVRGTADVTCSIGSLRSQPDSGHIEGVMDCWQVLLSSVATDLNTPVSRLSLMSEAARRHVLQDFNHTAAAFPQESLIHELFEEHVAQAPSALAIISGEERVEYAELNRRANQLAHYLRQRDLATGDRVGLCVRRDVNMVVGMLAVFKAGGAYVPMDPMYPPARLKHMLDDATPRLVLTQSSLRGSLGDWSGPVIEIDGERKVICSQPHENLSATSLGLTSSHLAYVIYTSGSTGVPKGAMNDHRGMVNRIAAAREFEAFDAADVCCQKTSISYVDSVFETFGPLCYGLPLVIVPANALVDLRALAALIAKEHVTRIVSVPSVARAMLEDSHAMRQVARLRSWTLSGEAVQADLLRRLHHHLPTCEFIVQYGSSEVSSDAAIYKTRRCADDVVPIGRPMANVRIYILDPHGEPVPIGAPGEIHVAGVGVGRGYLKRDELTAARFVRDPFSDDPSDRMYRTGDLGRWRADGVIKYLGRNDHQVKIRGMRVELGEIEAQLLRCDHVREAVVVAREVSPGEKRLVAYVAFGRAGAAAAQGAQRVKQTLKRALPNHMVPSVMMVLEALPRTPNGKVDRLALPTPNEASSAVPVGEPLQSLEEQILADIWRDLLQVQTLGREANFFELGGDSLLIARLLGRLRAAGFTTQVQQVYESASLGSLAQQLVPYDAAVEASAEAASPVGSATELLPEMFPGIGFEKQHLIAVARTVPGGAANIQDLYSLSPMQEGLLFQHLLSQGGDDTYVTSTLLSIDSAARLEQLVAALQRMIDRYDVLRTSVLWEELPRPIQVVWRSATLPVYEGPFGDKHAASPLRLDLGRAPLMRLQVSRQESGAWRARLDIHHLVIDDVSLKLITSEIVNELTGVAAKHTRPAPYKQHVLRALEQASDAEAYFREKLGDIDEPAAPFGLMDVRGDGSSVDEARTWLDPELAQRIRSQARRLGVSAATLFHAGWSLVVAHTTSRHDVVFGTVLLGRLRGGEQADLAVGMFINTLPLRLRLGQLTAEELVRQTRLELAGLLNHEQASLAVAQRCSSIASTVPLFSSILNYRHDANDTSQDWQQAEGILVEAIHDRTNYPITVSVDAVGERFALTLQTDNRISSKRVATFLGTALSSLVTALESVPRTQALSLQVLPEEERERVVMTFNDTRKPYPARTLVHELIEAQVARSPHAMAVSYGDVSLSYEELNVRANQLARFLRSHGIGPDKLVGVCTERSIEMVVALLGILKAGAAYVPLDPSYPSERLQYMLQDSAPAIVLTLSHLKSTILSDAPQTVTLDSDWGEIARFNGSNLMDDEVVLADTNLAYVIYTSGSTGRPKGAMNEHRAVVNRLRWMQDEYGIGAHDRVLQKTPYSFDVSVWEFFWTLMMGARLVIARPQGHQDPEYLREIIESSGVTTIHFVPSMLKVFLDQHDVERCTSLKLIVCSGEELPIQLQNRCMERLPGARLANLYGPTEAAVDVTYWDCRRDEQGVRVPIGRPIANVRMYVLSHGGLPAPIGVAGEIFIGGVGVGRGYWRRPDLTADRFIPDPFDAHASARLYKTGDQGCWREDGTIDYLGRNDHQVKIRGLRIELGEIEAQLRGHGSIKEVVVLARSVRGDKQLVAYLVQELGVAKQSPVDAKALRAHLGAHLPAYMVPSAFVTLDRMPLSPNGKLDRRALPEPNADGYSREQYEAPEGDVENIVARVWEQVLQVERVGRRDNFFELGGHSLLIVQVMERLRQAGFAPNLRVVLNSGTLADLAAKLSVGAAEAVVVPPNGIPTPCAAITPQMLPLVDLTAEQLDRIVASVPGGACNVQDIYPLASLQEGLLFHHALGGQGDAYVVPTLLRLRSRDAVDRLIDALQSAVKQHDVLRTAVLWEELPRPVQVVYRRAELPVRELAFDPRCDAAEQYGEWMRTGSQRLDLRRAPLMQLQVAEDPNSGEWYALLQLHHIVGDDLSQEIIVSEVVARFKGEPPPQSPSVPYRNHVAQALANAGARNSEQFFREKLADVDETTAPFGLLDTQGDGSRIEEAHHELPEALGRSIRAQARQLGVSTAALFHAAWGLVVAASSGRDDVVFGTVLLGRLQGDVGAQRVLGMFINTLPLRLRIAGVSAKELVLHTHRELIGLLDHEQAPLAVAQRCSSVPGTMPLFSALLNYRHRAAEHAVSWDSVPEIEVMAERDLTNYPFTMSVNDSGTGFALTAHTDRRVDPKRVNGYLQEALQALTQALEHQPESLALGLSILPSDERHDVIVAFNATQTDCQPRAPVHELFERRATLDAHAVALLYEGQTLTYGELNAAANRLARYLRAHDVKAGERIPVLMSRSAQMVLAQLAVLKSGGVYVPIDPALPPERQCFMVKDCGARLGLIDGSLTPGLEGIGVKWIDCSTAQQEISALSADNLNVPLTTPAPAYVMYTSGSTGTPKGVLVAHRGINRLVLKCGYAQFSAEDCFSHCSNPSFDASTFEIWAALLNGARLLIVPQSVVFEAPALAACLIENRVSVLFLTIGLFTQHLEVLAPVFPQLRYLITGGDVLEPAVARRVLSGTPPRNFLNAYGPTECTTYAMTHLVERVDQDTRAIPIGRPISNTQVYILNSARQVRPIGAEGEIYIGGAGVALQYLSRPELTEQRFVPDPFSSDPDARLYRTGDKGRWWRSGVVEFRGRVDDQVKIRGFRIEPGEVEAQLLRHPMIDDAVVLARSEAGAEKRLVAYVVPNEALADGDSNGQLSLLLREYLKQGLPEYMIPSAWVVMDKLPITPNGKVDRRALPAPAAEAIQLDDYAAPESSLEQELALSWAAVLRLERVGVNSNFFELGGHSLSAMKLVADASTRFGVGIPVVTVFRSPTIKQMTLAIEALRQACAGKQSAEIPEFEEGAL